VATTLELWERFAEAEFPHLRPRTQRLYAQRWRRWQVFIGHAFPAAEATLEKLDQYRAALTKVDMAPNQIGEHLKQVKLVYAWAEQRELVARNRIALYRFKLGKEERRHEPAEYRIEDFERLVAQLSPQSSRTWRPWALLMVLGHQGVRVRAALHLSSDDVDSAAARLTWRPAFDKLGREWSQPLRLGTCSALCSRAHSCRPTALGCSSRRTRGARRARMGAKCPGSTGSRRSGTHCSRRSARRVCRTESFARRTGFAAWSRARSSPRRAIPNSPWTSSVTRTCG
jgi:integrase